MKLKDKIIVLIILSMSAIRADECPDYKQHVVIPRDYIKYLPDAKFTGNVSKVMFHLEIKRIRHVKEER